MINNSVVVTGFGVSSPLGLDALSTWKALISGVDARQEISLFETLGCRCRFGAQVSLPPSTRKERRFSRASRLALMAAREALKQAHLLHDPLLSTLPICASTTGGAMEWGQSFVRGAIANTGKHQFSQVARYQPQQQVLDLQREFGINGAITIIGNACASGANAIGHGFDLIKTGTSECVLVGGYEALTELIFMGFDCLQAMSLGACRPFDVNRDGLMLGEGAAFLVLENEHHAQARGVEALGRILGYGHTTDLHHLTQPEPNGHALRLAMATALQDASLQPDQISYVNAHGTGTPMNDGAEAKAYAELFRETLPHLAISSTKSAHGHTLGAAGALEAVITLCALRSGVAPPQLHNQVPIEELNSSLVKSRRALDRGKFAMSVNLGFGGSNAALVFGL